jgi:hypothetical protein
MHLGRWEFGALGKRSSAGLRWETTVEMEAGSISIVDGMKEVEIGKGNWRRGRKKTR